MFKKRNVKSETVQDGKPKVNTVNSMSEDSDDGLEGALSGYKSMQQLRGKLQTKRGLEPSFIDTDKDELVDGQQQQPAQPRWGLQKRLRVEEVTADESEALALQKFLESEMGVDVVPAKNTNTNVEDRILQRPTIEENSLAPASNSLDRMSWVTGLAEMPLSVDYKLANIYKTEKEKLKIAGGGAPDSEGNAIMTKAERAKDFFKQKSGECTFDAAISLMQEGLSEEDKLKLRKKKNLLKR